MGYDVVEENLKIGYYGEQTNNYLNFSIQVLEAESIITPKVLNLDKHIQWTVCGICWVLLFVGTYFRYLLYSFLFDSYKSKESKPIDTLILVISVVQHINIVLFVTRLTLILLNDTNLDQIGAQAFCIASGLIYQFDVCYSCIGSLGISLFRILYIKHDVWLKYGFGEKKYMCTTLLVGLSLATIFVTSFNINDYSQIQRDTCMTAPQIRTIIQWLEEYKESKGDDSFAEFWNSVAQVVVLILLTMTLAEIATYCMYFYTIYKHDNSETLARLLEPAVIRKRNKRNAITFFGQFCSFVFDIIINISLIIALANFGKGSGVWSVIYIMKTAGFSAMSIVEVLTSSKLRSRMKLPFKSNH